MDDLTKAPKESVGEGQRILKLADDPAKCEECNRSFAARFSKGLALEYGLSYRAQVNLEGTINTMVCYGLSDEQIMDVLVDIYDNTEFVEVVEARPVQPDEVESGIAGKASPTGEMGVVKTVWTVPGCIVCDLCEDIIPQVFKMMPTTVAILTANKHHWGKWSDKIIEAAVGCPVNVIKYELEARA